MFLKIDQYLLNSALIESVSKVEDGKGIVIVMSTDVCFTSDMSLDAFIDLLNGVTRTSQNCGH